MQRTNHENNLPPPYLYIDPLDTFPYYSRTIPVLFPYYSRAIPVLFPYNKAANKQTLSHLYAKPKTTKEQATCMSIACPELDLVTNGIRWKKSLLSIKKVKIRL